MSRVLESRRGSTSLQEGTEEPAEDIPLSPHPREGDDGGAAEAERRAAGPTFPQGRALLSQRLSQTLSRDQFVSQKSQLDKFRFLSDGDGNASGASLTNASHGAMSDRGDSDETDGDSAEHTAALNGTAERSNRVDANLDMIDVSNLASFANVDLNEKHFGGELQVADVLDSSAHSGAATTSAISNSSNIQVSASTPVHLLHQEAGADEALARRGGGAGDVEIAYRKAGGAEQAMEMNRDNSPTDVTTTPTDAGGVADFHLSNATASAQDTAGAPAAVSASSSSGLGHTVKTVSVASSRGSSQRRRSMGTGEEDESRFVDVLMRKKAAYLALKQWEEERSARSDAFHRLTDPLISELFVSAQKAKEVLGRTVKHLKEKTKLKFEYATRLQQATAQLRGLSLLNSPRRPSFTFMGTPKHEDSSTLAKRTESSSNGAHPAKPATAGGHTPKGAAHNALQLPTGALEVNGGLGGPDSPTGGGASDSESVTSGLCATSGRAGRVPVPFEICTEHLFNALTDWSRNESKAIEVYAKYVETKLVQEALLQLHQRLEGAFNLCLQKIRNSRGRLSSQTKEIKKAWADFERQYKEVEKQDFAPKEAKSRDFKDCWLCERRYLIAAQLLQRMQQDHYKLLIEMLVDMQNLENHRYQVMQDILKLYIVRGKEVLARLASHLGTMHGSVDPEGFAKARATFLASSGRGGKGGDAAAAKATTRPCSQTLEDAMPAPQVASIAEGSRDLTAQQSASAGTNGEEPPAPSSPIEPVRAPVSKYNVMEDPVICEAGNHLDYGAVPKARLIMKEAFVKRYTGSMVGKWSDGMLALTWDRFLHMFRSHDDMVPAWSVCMNVAEVRLLEDKAGVRTVEIRERKNLYVVVANKSFYFRTLSEEDLDDWLRVLSLACSADDTIFTSQAAGHPTSGKNAETASLARIDTSSTPDASERELQEPVLDTSVRVEKS